MGEIKEVVAEEGADREDGEDEHHQGKEREDLEKVEVHGLVSVWLSGCGCQGVEICADELNRQINTNCVPVSPQQGDPSGHTLREREGFERGPDFAFRCASIPQSVQESGNPISQREWLTFKAAGFPVAAVDDLRS